MTRPRRARDLTATRARDRDCDGDCDHQRMGDHSTSDFSATRELARCVSSSAPKKAFTVL